MRLKNKNWATPFLSQHPELVVSANELIIKVKSLIMDSKEIYLEIGCGKGDFLLKMATKFPEVSFIGIERALTAVAIAGKKLFENPHGNVFFSWIDFSNLATELPDHCFKGIFLNFSDPWPKKRHEKRRLTADWFLNEYRRLLISNGHLIIKTDNQNLFEFTKNNLQKHLYNIEVAENDYSSKDVFDAQSEYETRFREQGKPIFRLISTPGEKPNVE